MWRAIQDANVLLGLGTSTEGCCAHYDPNLPELLPGNDFRCCKAESLGQSTDCQAAKMAVDDLGGIAMAKLLLSRTSGGLQ